MAAEAPKADAVKKPVGGAYGIFMNEKRDEFKKQAEAAGDKSFGGAAKLASAAWKAMGDAEKAKYEARYQEAKAKYDAYKESDDFVAPERKAKRGEDKPQKDKDAPKRPAGGAYGQFMNEKRAEFKKKAEDAGDKSFGGPAKLASEAWKAMGEAEKKVYEEKYQAAKAKYEEDMAAYKASKPDAPSPAKSETSSPGKGRKAAAKAKAKAASKEASPQKEQKEQKAAGKRKAASPPQPAKKPRAAKAGAPQPGAALDASVLKEADSCGMRASLENLAGRKEVAAKGFDGAKLLKALQDSDGLVNKAKLALLGA